MGLMTKIRSLLQNGRNMGDTEVTEYIRHSSKRFIHIISFNSHGRSYEMVRVIYTPQMKKKKKQACREISCQKSQRNE